MFADPTTLPPETPPGTIEPSTMEPGTTDRLRAYAALLATWTRRINLVSASDQAHIWPRHIQDSLRLIPFIPPGTSHAIDLGSGAGFPGLVLAIATGIPFGLIEADHRKAAFLREAARHTAAPVTVHAARIESRPLPPAPLVTARALAPLAALLPLAAPLLAPGGTMLVPKGAGAAAEVDAARTAWHFDLRAHGNLLALTNPRPLVHA